MSILDEHIEPHIGVNLNDPWFRTIGFRTIDHDPYGKIYIMRRSFSCLHHELEIHRDRNGNGRIKYLDLSAGVVRTTIDTNEYTDPKSFQLAIIKAIQDYVNFEGPFYKHKTQPHKSKIRRFLEKWLGFTKR